MTDEAKPGRIKRDHILLLIQLAEHLGQQRFQPC